ncbi:MAG: hypothetical protein IPN19_14420 [Elusimicrobia bacterium]|nr:hypothetical protein [Elusimicrobiota bacterium]
MLGGRCAVSLAWVGIVLACVSVYWARSADRDFQREGRRYVELWADRLAEFAGQPDRQDLLVRRFSAESDSQTAGIVDLDGRWVVRAGPAVDVPSFPSPSKIHDKRLNVEAWLFRAPMWVDGRRSGDVVWVRRCEFLLRGAQRRRRGFMMAWVWWAVAGGIGLATALWAGQNGVLGVNTRDDAIDPTPQI